MTASRDRNGLGRQGQECAVIDTTIAPAVTQED